MCIRIVAVNFAATYVTLMLPADNHMSTGLVLKLQFRGIFQIGGSTNSESNPEL